MRALLVLLFLSFASTAHANLNDKECVIIGEALLAYNQLKLDYLVRNAEALSLYLKSGGNVANFSREYPRSLHMDASKSDKAWDQLRENCKRFKK